MLPSHIIRSYKVSNLNEYSAVFNGLLNVINVIEKFNVLTAAVSGIERALPRRGHLADPFIPPLISQNIESVFALCKVLVIQRFTKYFKLVYFLQSLLKDSLCTSAKKKKRYECLSHVQFAHIFLCKK